MGDVGLEAWQSSLVADETTGSTKDEACNGHGHSHGEACNSHGHNHGEQSFLHAHSHMPAAGEGHTCLLTFVVVSNTVLTIAQLAVSLALKSLSLFIDSVDMTLDVLGYAMNLYTQWYGTQPDKDQRTRLKLELSAAGFTIVCTIGLSIWIVYDAVQRLEAGDDHDMELGSPMLIFASIGLTLNFVSLALFHMKGLPTMCHGNEGQLNLCSALLHLIGDVIRMIAIFGSGLYITISGTEDSGKIDAYCAIFVSMFSIGLIVPVVYGFVMTIKGMLNKNVGENLGDQQSLLSEAAHTKCDTADGM